MVPPLQSGSSNFKGGSHVDHFENVCRRSSSTRRHDHLARLDLPTAPLSKTTFVVLKDCTGEAQCVAASAVLRELHLKADDAVRSSNGPPRRTRKAGNRNRHHFREGPESSSNYASVQFIVKHGVDLFRYSSRIPATGAAKRHVSHVFRIQAAILRYFREFLAENYFTRLCHKIVSGGTEGGTNLFAIQY
jgi:nondiscriminating aspartyl-tRNA synthetase